MMASPLLIVALINEVINRPVAEIQCVLIAMDKGTPPEWTTSGASFPSHGIGTSI